MNLNQITIGCIDYAASVAFYKALGLNQIVDSPPRYARFECVEGGTTLSIHHVEPERLSPGTMIYFEVPDVDQRVAELEQVGLVFSSPPRDERWLWREARLADPAGNPVCIYHAGENRRNPPWRMSE